MNIFFPLNLICMVVVLNTSGVIMNIALVLQIVFVVGQVVLMKRDGVFR